MADDIVVYGSNWCGYTIYCLRHLDKLGVPYRYVDVDQDAAAEKLIASWNKGRSIRPTVDLQGDVFVNPTARVMEEELKKRGLMPSTDASGGGEKAGER